MKIYDEKLQKAVVLSIIENELTAKETEAEVEAIMRDSGELRRKLARKVAEYDSWNQTVENSSKEIIAADKMRQLVKVTKSVVEIARKSGLRVLTGQLNTDKYLEVKIQILKGGENSTAENVRKAA